jgi:two-component system, chemotaxis family, CheB/CheR fusion protein
MSVHDPAKKPQQPAALPEPAPRPGPPFPVVGVGASAGGLESFTELLQNLPRNPGVAILYVSHLEPHHKSHLEEILTKVTGMPVREVREGMTVEMDHVYLIPPNTNMALADGKLALTPRSPVRGQHMPIDHLFRSIAAIQRDRSIAVLLSGGGTDGTLGFQAVKAEGGITIAQDENSASQPSMPRSAILDGSVDYVLPPSDIARQIVRLVRHAYAGKALSPEPALTTDAIAEILALIRSATEVDFTHYKPTTVTRRIQRRLALRDCHGLDEYLQLLRKDRDELNNLYQDLLIRVTQFFRDPEAYELLKEKVFPALVQGRTQNRPIRIWVAGCSTGEEVYSLAIALLEFLDSRPTQLPIKILATDLNDAALEKARNGIYVDNIENDVSPERLRRFFNRANNHYQISKAIRELCIFSRHNLTTDPPFSHLDLVSCRNLLIYLDTALQSRVLPVFHYALAPDGYLFLGSSENIGPFTELFDPVDSRHRIFRKRLMSSGTHVTLDFGSFVFREGRSRRAVTEETAVWSALDVQREADRIVLARYAPVGVVVDETMTVVQFRGRTAAYLEPAPDLATLDLFRMLSESLLAEVRSALDQARAENTAVTREGLRSVDGMPVQPVRVEVIPFKVPPSGVRFFLILFEDVATEETKPAPPRPEVRPSPDTQVLQLQQELGAMREYLQSVIEEQESTSEELKSANEEILSANEELQSTNEELQTAKEEAQSANEELATVNDELRHRNVELARVNNDLVNLLSGVGIPIVMVSRDLRVRRFTPPAEKLFNLIPTDVGRPISDIKPNLDLPDLAKLITRVIDSLTPYEGVVRDQEGRRFYLRVRPYVTLDKTIDGAWIVLLDVSAFGAAAE